MKKTIGLFLTVLVVTMMSIVNVKANYNGFGGSAGFTYAQVSSQNTKDNYQYLAGINWTYSSYSNHKMWFQIRNSNGDNRGEKLLSGTSSNTVYFNTTAEYGHYYYLYAHREHIVNPSTYVSGTWQP